MQFNEGGDDKSDKISETYLTYKLNDYNCIKFTPVYHEYPIQLYKKYIHYQED